MANKQGSSVTNAIFRQSTSTSSVRALCCYTRISAYQAFKLVVESTMRIETESEQPLIKMSSSQGELDLPWLQHAGLMTVVYRFVLHTLGLEQTGTANNLSVMQQCG